MVQLRTEIIDATRGKRDSVPFASASPSTEPRSPAEKELDRRCKSLLQWDFVIDVSSSARGLSCFLGPASEMKARETDPASCSSQGDFKSSNRARRSLDPRLKARALIIAYSLSSFPLFGTISEYLRVVLACACLGSARNDGKSNIRARAREACSR